MIYYILLLSSLALAKAEVKVEYSWKYLHYQWENESLHEQALLSGALVHEHNVPLGMAVSYWRLFVAVPRRKPGVPSSLNYVDIAEEREEQSPALKPYPSWGSDLLDWAGGAAPLPRELPETSAVSATAVSVDDCERLWVMDTGLDNNFGTYPENSAERKMYTTPSIMIFNLTTDSLITRYYFKDTDFRKTSFFSSIAVDVSPSRCEDSYAYAADQGESGLVVYSMQQGDSWRVRHHYFHFDPLAGTYNVRGIAFQWAAGVSGLALSDVKVGGFRRLYFHPLSSVREFEVCTSVLRNKTFAQSPTSFQSYTVLGEKGLFSQASASFFYEERGVLFYTQVNRNGVACWNPDVRLNPMNTYLVVSSGELLEYPNAVQVFNDELWMMSNRLPRFMYTSLKPNETNFRILSMSMYDAINDTPCSMTQMFGR